MNIALTTQMMLDCTLKEPSMNSIHRTVRGSIKIYENIVTQMLNIDSRDYERLKAYSTSDQSNLVKDSENTTELRLEGNEIYSQVMHMEDFIKLIGIYNKSIAFAPNDSEKLALAYGNRAMVLFRLKYFNECLVDINRALCLVCPKKTMEKLLIKRVRCMKILNHPDVLVVYNECLDWVDKNSTNVQKMKTEIQKAFQNDKLPICEAPINTKFRDDLLTEMKKSCPSLDKVQIGRNSKGDLTLVAAKDIHVGEVIAAEKMYTQVLHLEQEFCKGYLACWHCVTICLNPIPCDGCTSVVYCSELCKAEAWSKYHEYECSIIDHIIHLVSTYVSPFRRSVAISNILIPMKICMGATKQLGGIIPLMEEVEKLSQTKDIQEEHRILDGVYPSESYRSVFYMINKSNMNGILIFEKCNNDQCYFIITTSVYLLATRTTIFNKKYEGELSTVMQEQVPKFFASLILRHFELFQDSQQFASNQENHSIMKSTSVCPLLFILNHSCNPNSAKFMVKDHQVLVAIDEIKTGQEINVSFFPNLLIDENIVDGLEMKMNHFGRLCNCEACGVNVCPPELVSFIEKNCANNGRTSEKSRKEFIKMTTMYRAILDKVKNSPPRPRSAAEFLKWAADLYKDLKKFFPVAPPLCKEVIDCKKLLLMCIFNVIHLDVYNFLNSD